MLRSLALHLGFIFFVEYIESKANFRKQDSMVYCNNQTSAKVSTCMVDYIIRQKISLIDLHNNSKFVK